MTVVVCKSDCEFAQNSDRACSLQLIELSQIDPNSPVLHCNQYNKGKLNPKFAMTDIERAREAGAYAVYMDKLNPKEG